MNRACLLLFLSPAFLAAKITDYSTDMVILDEGQVTQTLKLYVSGQKSRVEGFLAGPLGRIVTIARRDMGVSWTLYVDKRQYSETSLSSSQPPGKTDLSNLDLMNMRKQTLGRETVLGYACTKMRVSLGNQPNGQPLHAIVWVADALELPVRLDVMGFIQENRNLRAGPQPTSLFEIPAGYRKTSSPGMLSEGRTQGGYSHSGRTTAEVGLAALRGGVAEAALAGARRESRMEPANWKVNTNLPGGDYRAIDMATSNPERCRAACEKEAACLAWTLVKPESPGGMGYCWLKNSIPEATREDCCISGLKGATLGESDDGRTTPRGRPRDTGGSAATGWRVNINLPGGDYRSFDIAASSPSRCKSACDKESRCLAWTFVKPGEPGGMGTCWLKDSVPEATQEDCCISGVKR